MKCERFISDFEENIPKGFTKYFPGIETQGCLFHFGKSIWGRVHKNGMSPYYNAGSSEPKFGNFVRLLLGLPYLKIEDLRKGFQNAEKTAQCFKTERCKKFAKQMLNYVEKEWMSKRPEYWNVYMVHTRTNNRAEAYNNAIGLKVRAHPNPYQLITVFVDELINSCDELMAASLGKIKKKKSSKTKLKLCRQKALMEKYSQNNIDLLVYQLCIGHHYLKNSKKIGESGEKFDDEDYFMDIDIDIDENELSNEMSDIVELQYTNFNCDLSKNTIIEPSSKPDKPRRQRKATKRQKPAQNSRKSYSKFPHPNIDQTSLMLMATAGAVLIGSSLQTEDNDVEINPDNESNSNYQSNANYQSNVNYQSIVNNQSSNQQVSIKDKLRTYGLMYSTTQPETPPDGNCMFFAILDQIVVYRNHMDFRRNIIDNVENMINENSLFWPYDHITIEEWSLNMEKRGEHGDHICLQVASNLCGRDLIIISTNILGSPNMYNSYNRIPSYARTSDVPVLLLYFQETDYSAGHYQSIQRIPNTNCSLLSNYNFKLSQENSRRAPSTLPSQESVRVRPQIPSLSSTLNSPIFTSSRMESEGSAKRKRIPNDITTPKRMRLDSVPEEVGDTTTSTTTSSTFEGSSVLIGVRRRRRCIQSEEDDNTMYLPSTNKKAARVVVSYNK